MKSHDTAEYVRQVPNNDDDQADHGQGDDEAGVAAHQTRGRNYSKDQLKCKWISQASTYGGVFTLKPKVRKCMT